MLKDHPMVTTKGCKEISQGLSFDKGETPGFKVQNPGTPAGVPGIRDECPVVTRVSLANHRLISWHPFGVEVGQQQRDLERPRL
jgi:hypothetical protein